MTTHKLNIICLSLVSVLAMACGDARDAEFNDDAGFGEQDGDTGFGEQDGDAGLGEQDGDAGFGERDGDAGFGGAGGMGGGEDVDEGLVAPPDEDYHLTVVADGGDEVSLTDAVSYPEGDTEDSVSYSVDRRFALGQLEIRAFCDGEGEENIEFFHSFKGETFNCDPTGVLVVDRLVGPDIPGFGTITITALGGEDTFVTWILEGVVKPL